MSGYVYASFYGGPNDTKKAKEGSDGRVHRQQTLVQRTQYLGFHGKHLPLDAIEIVGRCRNFRRTMRSTCQYCTCGAL